MYRRARSRASRSVSPEEPARDPRTLFQAAGRVVRMLNLTPQDFGIDVMGTTESYDGVRIQALAREAGLKGFVRTYGSWARRDALEFRFW